MLTLKAPTPRCIYLFFLFQFLLTPFFLNAQNLKWENHYGGTGREWSGTIRPTSDGGYILAGRTDSADKDISGPAMGKGDIWVAKLDSTGGIEWEQNYGGSDDDVPHDIRESQTGEYILCGVTFSSDGDISGNVMGVEEDLWLVKLDSNGQIEWENNYGGSHGEQAHSVLEVGDGNFVVTGVVESSDGDVSGSVSGIGDMWILKVDPNGNLLWEKNHGSSDYDPGSEIQKAHDNGYVVAGRAMDSLGYNHQAYFAKLDSAGNKEWDKRYGGSMDEAFFSVKKLDDGGYITTGYSHSDDGDVSDNNGKGDIWVVELDSNGTIEWEKNYGGNNFETASSIHHTEDGGFIIGGKTRSDNGDVTPPQDSVDYWVLKLDRSGNIEWEECYGGTKEDHGGDIRPCPDGGYIMIGSSGSADQDVSGNHGEDDLWVLRLDTICAPLSSDFGSYSSDSLAVFHDSAEGNIETWHWSFGDGSTSKDREPFHIYDENGDFQVCLTVEDLCGDTAVSCDTLTIDGFPTGNRTFDEASSATLYPSPFKDRLQIRLEERSEKVKVTFFDLQGREVWSRELGDGQNFTLHPQLPDGPYMFAVRSTKGASWFKVLKKR